MSVIAIDIGTSSIKAGLFSREGQLNANLSAPASPSAAPGEYDAEEWVESSFALLRKLSGVAYESLRGDRIEGICVCGNGPSLVAAGKDGKALMPALLWIDRRAKAEAEEISLALQTRVDPAFYMPKALWILRNREPVSEKIEFFMPCPEYLAFRLSGRAHAVLPSPGFAEYIWTVPALRASGLPERKFPPLVGPGEVLGSIGARIAGLTGLPQDCRVVSGLPDFMAAQLGAGVHDPGLALDRTGSSEAFNLCASRPFSDGRLFSLPHAVPGLWNVSGGVSTSGSAIAWLESALGAFDPRGGLACLRGEMERAGPGSDGVVFLPYLSGERAPLWNPDMRGAVTGLGLTQGRGHVARALLESIAFALREVMELQESAGLPCRAVHVSGGAASNDFLLRLKADILGKPVIVPLLPETELAGAAALALSAIGAYPDAKTAAAAIFKPSRAIEPDPRLRVAYEECYRRFLEVRGRLYPPVVPPYNQE